MDDYVRQVYTGGELKKLFLFEIYRKESFQEWKFGENSSCSITRMAEAGFYWCGVNNKDDTVKCFVCGKTLTEWDLGDDPWEEHRKHAPQCLFVQYNCKEGDLTVQQFLNIYSVVVKKYLMNEFNAIKNEFLREASLDLDKFDPGKS